MLALLTRRVPQACEDAMPSLLDPHGGCAPAPVAGSARSHCPRPSVCDCAPATCCAHAQVGCPPFPCIRPRALAGLRSPAPLKLLPSCSLVKGKNLGSWAADLYKTYLEDPTVPSPVDFAATSGFCQVKEGVNYLAW
jgi:hypothetical protein